MFKNMRNLDLNLALKPIQTNVKFHIDNINPLHSNSNKTATDRVKDFFDTAGSLHLLRVTLSSIQRYAMYI